MCSAKIVVYFTDPRRATTVSRGLNYFPRSVELVKVPPGIRGGSKAPSADPRDIGDRHVNI